MQKIMRSIMFLTVLTSLLFSQGHVIISEVVVGPANGDEFIELYNPGSAAVDLSHYHLSDLKNYYEITSGSFTNVSTNDFSVSFPAGTMIAPGGVLVVATYGSDFQAVYGTVPDFEIRDTDAGITDMDVDTLTGTGAVLANSREMLMLYYWDNSSATVQDVDYLPWGTSVGVWVDKSGISGYQNDTPESTQLTYAPELSVTNGYRLFREDAMEKSELTSGGNGLTGHDETSEHFNESFVTSLAAGNPGEFSYGSASSGSGQAIVTPTAAETGAPVSLQFKIWGDFPDALTRVELVVPADWNWSGQNSDVQLGGNGFSGASLIVNGSVISLANTAITNQDTGVVTLMNMVPGGTPTREDTFYVSTAISGESPVQIETSPVVTVTPGATPIDDIQANEAEYLGKTVKLRGVVVFGSGVLRNDQTAVYLVDDSGAGIEIFDFNYDDQFTRGDSIEITGVIGSYNSITQISNYTSVVKLAENRPVPKAIKVETGEVVGDSELRYEGYWLETTAPITDIYYAGGGTNVKVDDGSGEFTIRIWDTSGLNLDFFAIGDTIKVRGIETQYSGTPQLTTAYQQDIQLASARISLADGSGSVSPSADTLQQDSLVQHLRFTLTGSVPDTITTARITFPVYWDTTNLEQKFSFSGEKAANAVALWETEDGLKHVILSNLNLYFGDTLQFSFANVQAPHRNVLSTFHVQTAGRVGTLTNISKSPQLLIGNADSTVVPIYDVQRALSLFSGKTVTLEGRVTIGSKVIRTDRTSAYMQDESGFGINISSRTVYEQLVRGVLIRISGSVSDYQETTQIDPSSGNITVLDEIPVLIEPRLIKTAEVNGPKYDGTLVKVWGVVTELYSTSPGDYNVTVTDGSGPTTIRIWGTTTISPDKVEVGEDALFVTGVGGVYAPAGGEKSYQILPGYADQFVIDKNYEGTLANISLDLPSNPFVPDMGETIPITFNAGSPYNHAVVRVFDLQGRAVRTLFDENVSVNPSSVSWDGKDQYGNRVPLGVYICHLEVTVNRSGKRKIKTAPIVVGTVLK